MRAESIKKLFKLDIKEILERFPIPALSCAISTGILLILNHTEYKLESDVLIRIMLALFCTSLTTTSVKLFSENNGWDQRKSLSASLVAAALMFAFIFLNSTYWTAFTFIFPALFIAIGVSPYIFKKGNHSEAYSYFNCKISTSIFFAGFTSLVLLIGVVSVLKSVEYLFEVDISNKIYADIYYLIFAFFAPIYTLSGIPKKFSEKDISQYPDKLKFLTNYILSPLVSVYLVILYAYAVKIAAQWEMPKGHLGWMISTFGTIGILTYLLGYPLKNRGSQLIDFINKYFFIALVAPIGLLIVAVWMRVSQYGITEQRYVLIMIILWMAVSSTAMILSRTKNVVIIPLVFCILCVFSSFGPWGAISVSTKSQAARLEAILEKHGILINGKIKKATKQPPFADQKEISSMVEYLCGSERIESIRPWFPNNSEVNKKGEFKEYYFKYVNAQKVMNELGIDYVVSWQNEKTFSYGEYGDRLENSMLSVKGFDYITKIDLHYYGRNADKKRKDWQQSVTTESGKTIDITFRDNILKFSDKTNNRFSSIDLSGILKEIEGAGIKENPRNVTPVCCGKEKEKYLVIKEISDSNWFIRIYLSTIRGKFEQEDKPEINHLDAHVLIKDYQGQSPFSTQKAP